MSDTAKNICPVCHFDGLTKAAYDKRGFGSHEICPSCGFQFDVSDTRDGWSFQDWRNRFYSLDPRLVATILKIVASRVEIMPSTRIYHDLQIAGDDACEMLAAVTASCGVLLEGFDFNAYFPDETEALARYWMAKFGFDGKYRPLTVGHFSTVIRAGKWTEPV